MRIKTLLLWNLQRVAFGALLAVGLLLPALSGFTSSSSTGPASNAGAPQLVPVGATVRLDGSRSTNAGGGPLTYLWSFVSRPASSAAALNNPTAPVASFSVDQPGAYVVQLAVSDGTTVSNSQVTIATDVTPPIADAGPGQVVVAGAVVHLNGSASSDPDGDRLSFQWSLVSLPAGSQTSISDPAAVAPTFVADLAGTYVAQLVVSDTHGNSSSASVSISTQDLPPLANAGAAQLVAVGNTVQLNAAASSDPGGDPLTYSWSWLSVPAGSAAALSSATAVNPTFVADLAGTYVVQLAVSDTHGNSSLATVEVATDSIPPLANAGAAQTVAPGANVLLNGAASNDAGGAPLTYTWTLLFKPAASSAALVNATSPSSSFVADKPGQYLAQLVVSNGLNASLAATVLTTAAASGPNLVLSPSTLNFGNQPVGITSNQKGVTITNTGTTSVQITSFLLSGFNAREFSLRAAGFPLTVPPNGSVVLSITFTPGAEGTRSANIAFYDSTGGFPHGIALLGSGGTSAPMVQLTPQSITFADQSVGTSSASRSIAVTNIGNANLQITGLTIGGSDFAFAPSFAPPTAASPINLAANASTSFPVIFKPTTTGQRSANLSMTDNAGDSPQLAPLSGTGTPAQLSSITVTPSSITFPDQTVGNSSAPSSITVTNNTTGALQITSLTFSGANVADFSTTSTAPVNLPANGGAALIPVTFKPSATGARSATLTIADNSGGSPHSVSLSGNGAGNTPPPGISVSPNSLDFQSQAVGVSSSPLPITVTNGNSTSASISLSMAGVNSSEFSIKTARSFSVAAGGTGTISVVFTPQAAGARSALIIVGDDTGAGGHYVTLTGTIVSNVPTVQLSPVPLAFGDQATGTSSASKLLTVTNTGSANLQITGVAIGGANSGDFAFAPTFTPPTPAVPINVAANASTTIPVVFKPTTTGPRSASLMVTDNAGNSPQSAALTGNGTSGPPAPVTVTPASITFSDQTVGNSSAPSSITVTNNTTGALQVTGLAFSGANAGDFSTPSTAPLALPANGGTAIVPVTFKPSATGARSATLTIADNSGGNAHSVSLSGNGNPPTGISVTPNPLDFHSQTVGVSSSPMQIIVTNGNSTSAGISLSLAGVNSSEFSVKSARSFSVAAGGSGSISVVFTPQATGARSALIIVGDDTGGPGHYVTLQGTGGTSLPAVQLVPAPLAFGDQAVGASSTPRALTVTNTGNANLQITGVAIGGTNSGDFAFASTFTPPSPAVPINVAANASTTIPVIFTPTATNGRAAALMITDNASDSPQSAALTGNGTGQPQPVTVNPSSITFPDQTVGNSSPASAITVTNNTTGALQITGLTFSGANAGDFSTASTAPVVLPANGGTVIVPVTFKPSAAGARSASLTIGDNSGGSAHNVSLSGNGALGTGLSVTPATLDFHNQTLNVTSSPLPVTVKNIGGTTVSVTGVLMVGVNGSDFSTTGARSFSLAPGATSVLNILFTPKDMGARSATLIVSDDTGGQGHSVGLTGTGVTATAGIKLDPSLGLSFANQQVGTTSAPMQVTVTNTGTAPLQISGLSFSGVNAGDFALSSSFVLGTTYPITVAANSSTMIPVVFKPTAKDPRTANLLIADNADGSPHPVELHGTGVTAIVASNPNPLDFQNQTLGTTSNAITLTVTNNGNAPLQITGLSFGGTNAGDFLFPANFTLPTAAAPITVAIKAARPPFPFSSSRVTLGHVRESCCSRTMHSIHLSRFR